MPHLAISCIPTDGRRLKDVIDDLNGVLHDQFPDHQIERLGPTTLQPTGDSGHLGFEDTFPRDYRWISCYAVSGGSEAHWVHVDVLVDHPGSHGSFAVRIAQMKVWGGLSQALAISNVLTAALGA